MTRLATMRGAVNLARGFPDFAAPVSGFGFEDHHAFCLQLVNEMGVGAVPGSSFFTEPHPRARTVRFCFCKKLETLDAAGERLQRLAGRSHHVA